MRRAGRRFFTRPAEALAPALLGRRLVRVLDDGTRLAGAILEAEAYVGVRDRASHAFGGRRTPRNESMYGRPGLAYVYFTYGMHHCFNVVCAREGFPAAVLVRALVPEEGLERMRALRGVERARLCAGPGNLCRAMAIDRGLDGEDLVTSGRLFIELSRPVRGRVRRTARIGLGEAGAWRRRRLRWVVA